MDVSEFTMIPIEQLELADFNANRMDEETLNKLVTKIQENGFDEPLQVCPIEGQKDKYVVVGGNHRLKAARILGMAEVPCSIKDWDEEKQKTEIVSRNLIKGDIDRKKFNSLVRDLTESGAMALKDISKRMGFSDDSHFLKYYKEDKKKRDELVGEAAITKAKDEVKAVEDVTFLLNKIFAEFGDTVPQGFMFFMHKGQMHLLTRMDKDMSKLVEEVCKKLRNDETNINEFLKKAFKTAEGEE